MRCQTLKVIAHTDATGSEKYNQELSEKRADAVESALVEMGVSETQINVAGAGESEPVADNKTERGPR